MYIYIYIYNLILTPKLLDADILAVTILYEGLLKRIDAILNEERKEVSIEYIKEKLACGKETEISF